MLRFEEPRPGPGWHRHDWKRRTLHVFGDGGPVLVIIERRRWRLVGTGITRLDRAPDEVRWAKASLLVVLLKVASWLLSGEALLEYTERPAGLTNLGARRSVQRWRRLLAPSGARLQSALRTAVIERSEPQPIENLFPGGLSPPEVIRCRRWKDPEALYRLANGLSFLVFGAAALCTSTTVLLAEARRRLHTQLLIAAP